MVDKGLVVTLVLDCCFSAGVYRDDNEATTRFLPYDVQTRLGQLPTSGDGSAGVKMVFRDASALPNWLINPDRYAILAVYGPHEVARELELDGVRHEAMSFFRLESIKTFGFSGRHGDIYYRIRAKFRGSGMQHQNPILYGNSNQMFFETSNVQIRFTPVVVPVVVTRTGTLELQAGHSHGVCDGDEFVLHPSGSDELIIVPREISTAHRVVRSGALTSDLESLDGPSTRVQSVWTAAPRVRSSFRKYRVRLPFELSVRNKLITLLETRSLNETADKIPYDFSMVLYGNGELSVENGSGRELIKLPKMLQDQTSADEIADVLEHLVQFRLVTDLGQDLPKDPFRESFDASITFGEQTCEPNALIEAKHGATAELIIHNRGTDTLHVFVYSLGPFHQVENIYRGTYLVVPSRDDEAEFVGGGRVKLQMKLPQEMKDRGCDSCDDTVKIFITSRPTSFDLLELPKIGRRNRKSQHTRNHQVNEGPEHWAALHFPILTSQY